MCLASEARVRVRLITLAFAAPRELVCEWCPSQEMLWLRDRRRVRLRMAPRPFVQIPRRFKCGDTGQGA